MSFFARFHNHIQAGAAIKKADVAPGITSIDAAMHEAGRRAHDEAHTRRAEASIMGVSVYNSGEKLEAVLGPERTRTIRGLFLQGERAADTRILNREIVQLGLLDWHNFRGSDGKPILFAAGSMNAPGPERHVLHDTLLRMIPDNVVAELATAIRNLGN